MCFTAARMERGSSLMLDDVSAIYATGAFLCSCFCTQVMSNYPAIEKKFPLDKISQRLVIQRTWAGGISLFQIIQIFPFFTATGERSARA